MNVEQLYQHLKDAANYFGVGFHGFHLIDARLEGNQLVLTCDGLEVRINIEDKP